VEFKRLELIWRRLTSPEAPFLERMLAMPLTPASWLYRSLNAVRRLAYHRGILKSHRLPVPTVSVGNLVLGGSGKTPLVMAIAEHLRRRGRRPMILSRGYGKVVESPRLVADGMGGVLANSRQCGEEAVMVANKATIGRRRYGGSAG